MDKGDLFSIRKWVSEEILDVYHCARGEMREGLKPALSLWIDTAIKAVLHLEPILSKSASGSASTSYQPCRSSIF